MKKHAMAMMMAAVMGMSLVASMPGVSAEEAETEAAADLSNLSGLTIGFSQSDNSSNWKIVETEDMQEKAEEYGINLIYTDASGDIAKQASDIEDLVAQGVDYLIVAPQQEDGLQASLIAAMDAGIPVILVDRGVNGDAGTVYTSSIMSDFVWEAEQIAERVIEYTGGTGNVVIIEGTQGATSTTDRQEGFMNTIEGTDLEVISDQVANYSQPEAQEVMENILQAQGDNIDIVYCHGVDMAIGAITAIKAANYVPGEDMQVVCVDASKDGMEAILAGELLCACSCSPFFGEATFSLISQLVDGETLEVEYINEDTVYDITNADVALGY
ncbi:MAG: ABC transporter substrate-binding protein [Lachnospiraceae bacterium]|nr:ABC transporter substrate-binding protein [Lachnospiraceae bacterium]